MANCPLTDEWIEKTWYIYTTGYYSVIKRNEIESVEVMWMNLESVIQSEVSQKEEKKSYINVYIWASLVAQMVKNPPAMQEIWIPRWIKKIPCRRE